MRPRNSDFGHRQSDANRLFGGYPMAITLGFTWAVSGCTPRAATSEAPAAAKVDSRPRTVSAEVPPASAPALVPERALTPIERIAMAVAAASPMGSPSDAGARDQAADRLADLGLLLDASEFHVFWGPFDPATGLELGMGTLTQLQPLVMARLYLSLFMFDGTFTVRDEEGMTVVELPARFRDQLPPGDYPHPLWQTPEEWSSFAQATSLFLVFSGERLGAVMMKPGAALGAAKARAWDGRWRWLDGAGVEQPRVAMYDAVFSKDNPHAKAADTAFRALEGALLANSCANCHAPDNRSRMKPLVVLTYPAQAIAARHSLAAVLREESMPPGDVRRGIPAGIRNEGQRQAMIQKADAFDQAVSEAIAFEEQRRKKRAAIEK